MTIHTFESLLENPPRKTYTDHKIGYLLPYLLRDRSLRDISTETGISEVILAGWLRNDLWMIEEAIVKQELALSEFVEQIGRVDVHEDINYLTVDQLLSNGPRYQEGFLGRKTPGELSAELGIDEKDVRRHMYALYANVHGAFKEKSLILDQLMQRVGVTASGQHG